MKFQLKPYTIQHVGKRANQEDSMFPAFGESTPNDRLFILCDGMGGHAKGEVASATVCDTMSQYILGNSTPTGPFSVEIAKQAVNKALDALDEKDDVNEEKKMGTTMTMLKFHEEGFLIAHIGDSRVYHLRPASKEGPAAIKHKTRDHSLVNDLIRVGELTQEEAKTFSQKNVITRAMLPHLERRPKADVYQSSDVRPGDYFFLCSDGMLENTDDDNLLFIITKPDISDEEKVNILYKVTENNADNHTAHLIHVTGVEGALTQSPQFTQGVTGAYINPNSGQGTRATSQTIPNKNVTTPLPVIRKTGGNKIVFFIALLLILATGTFFAFKYLWPSDKNNEQEVTKNTVEKGLNNVEVGDKTKDEIVTENKDSKVTPEQDEKDTQEEDVVEEEETDKPKETEKKKESTSKDKKGDNKSSEKTSDSKTPAKSDSKTTEKKSDSKTPAKSDSKTTEKKSGSKTPVKSESKTPVKSESKTPVKSDSKTPAKSESKEESTQTPNNHNSNTVDPLVSGENS